MSQQKQSEVSRCRREKRIRLQDGFVVTSCWFVLTCPLLQQRGYHERWQVFGFHLERFVDLSRNLSRLCGILHRSHHREKALCLFAFRKW